MSPARSGDKYKMMKQDWKIRILLISLIFSVAVMGYNYYSKGQAVQTGLDLQGGSLILVRTEIPLNETTEVKMSEVTKVMEERINNMFHVRDVKIRPWGEDLIMVEIAGVDADQAKKLIGNPGKLEAYVGNVSAFTGSDLARVDVYAVNPSSNLYTVPFTLSDAGAVGFREAGVASNFGRVSMFMDRGTAVIIFTDPAFKTLVTESQAGGVLISWLYPGSSEPRELTYTEAIDREIIQAVPDLDDPLAAQISDAYDVDTSSETITMDGKEVGKYISISKNQDELGQENIDAILEMIQDSGVDEESIGVYQSNMVNNAPLSQSLIAELAAGQTVKSLLLDTGLGDDARDDARRIEVILRSGALPIRVSIVGSYEVPASLGEKFAKNAILSGILVLIGVSIVIFLRYRKWELVLPVIVTGVSEVVLILGASSLIGHNIDLPSIAGIIAAIGTGFDNQIVILDEVLMEKERSMARRMKDAFFIVMGSWFTLMAAMVPLFIIGMAQLKGFAIVTIIGATSGVFITRPAYAKLLYYNLKYK